MNDLQTFVINLDRSADRLARVGSALDSLGLPWTRVPAVDGAAMPEEERTAYLDEPAFQRQHGMPSVPGELGCYLSHVRAMQRFLEGTAQMALILEDDVRLLPSLPQVLQALQACAAHWDMVKVSGVHSGTPVRVRRLTDEHWLAVMLTRCTGASATLINRHAARRYVDQLLPMSLPYDHAYDKGWRFGLKVRMVTPWPAIHDNKVPTTIAQVQLPAGRTTRKFHWTRRLPAYMTRARNEIRRIFYGIGQIIAERGVR